MEPRTAQPQTRAGLRTLVLFFVLLGLLVVLGVVAVAATVWFVCRRLRVRRSEAEPLYGL